MDLRLLSLDHGIRNSFVVRHDHQVINELRDCHGDHNCTPSGAAHPNGTHPVRAPAPGKSE